MTTLPLIYCPDPLLQQVSKPVTNIDKKLQEFMDDLLETMYEEEGLGLSAVQVGVLKRVLVMDVGNDPDKFEDEDYRESKILNKRPIFMVNPEIIESSEETSVFYEGCLSFPDARADVVRSKEVTVEYLDYHGEKQIMYAKGILATCVQHEIDHLNGITFVDHLSKLKREIIIRKLKKKNLNG